MVLDKDFREFIESLNAHDVRYLIVGGHAVGLHGYPRYTKDLDGWVDPSLDNAGRLMEALKAFGLVISGLTANDFTAGDDVIQLGFPPNRIDILTGCSGVEFDACFQSRLSIDLDGLPVNIINLDDL